MKLLAFPFSLLYTGNIVGQLHYIMGNQAPGFSSTFKRNT